MQNSPVIVTTAFRSVLFWLIKHHQRPYLHLPQTAGHQDQGDHMWTQLHHSNQSLPVWQWCDPLVCIIHSNWHKRGVDDHVPKKLSLQQSQLPWPWKQLPAFSYPFPNSGQNGFQGASIMTCSTSPLTQRKKPDGLAWCAGGRYAQPEEDRYGWSIDKGQQFWEDTTNLDTLTAVRE